ncbi:MAG TPA: carboxypeptidase-like regulatory domain-containing protein [Bryobacteraceae bacterium]|nr:carboxypeptidase-like regulatory domain-containing protein [Bryobacteraceae bacterium]
MLALAMPMMGQTFGEITGVVSDSTGAIVVGATVTVTNPQTNLTRQVTSNSSGNYNFPSLLPGVYNVKAEMQGFQSEIRQNVELQVQQVARIDFQLKVGAMTETVEVQGGAPLLNTENATVGTVIDNQRILDLPLNGRDFTQLITLSPNVSSGYKTTAGGFATSRQGGDRATENISVSGLRREYTYYTLDGISNQDIDFNTYLFLPSIDALQEFKIQTGVYSTEFGREAVQVNVSTVSGTNQYHGTAFEFLRNSNFDARPFGFTSTVPVTAPFKWNQYGFMLGGPVQIPKLFNGKDRLFFMSNYEGFKLRNQQQNVYSVPSAAMRTGNFSELLPKIMITDPLNNNAPFEGNIIKPERLNQTSLAMLKFYPAPNIAGAGLVNNHLALDNVTEDKDQFTQRIDFAESSKSSWFGRYSFQTESSVTPALFENGSLLTTNDKQAMISNTRILSPALVNEFRFGYSYFFNAIGTELANKEDVVAEMHLPLYLDPPPIAWGIPSVGIQGFSGFGDNVNGPFVTIDNTFQWSDNVAWTKGVHSMRIGADISRYRYNQFGNQNTRGVFSFQNQATGYGFADYLLGYAAVTADAGSLAIAQLRDTNQAYYIDDNWKVRSNITIDMGLRYEYIPPFSDRSDSMVNVDTPCYNVLAPGQSPATIPQSCHPTLVRTGTGEFYQNTVVRFGPGIQVARDGRLGSDLYYGDKKNFAPRVGIAWSPSPSWTLRVGAGFFYVQDQSNPYFDLSRNLAGRVQDSANLATHDLTWQHPFTSSASSCGVPVPPFVCITSPLLFQIYPHHPTSYVEQYLFNIQRQLTKSTVMEVGYIGSEGHHLGRFMFFNPTTPGPASSPITAREPYPEFTASQTEEQIVNSNYQSLTVKVTRRLSNGLTFLAGYTFSKAIDDGSGIDPPGTESRQPQNGWCVQCERSLSTFDQRHRFVISTLYQLPFGSGRQFLNRGLVSKLAGGWELSSFITVSSGLPLMVVDGSNIANTALLLDRPNATGISPKLTNPTTGEWFNANAFVVQPQGNFGNLGRNVPGMTGPGIFEWDGSLLKNFNFTEKKYLQFRFEVFNASNSPNLGDPGLALAANRTVNGIAIPGTGTFGQITSLRNPMREVQLSLKLVF